MSITQEKERGEMNGRKAISNVVKKALITILQAGASWSSQEFFLMESLVIKEGVLGASGSLLPFQACWKSKSLVFHRPALGTAATQEIISEFLQSVCFSVFDASMYSSCF